MKPLERLLDDFRQRPVRHISDYDKEEYAGTIHLYQKGAYKGYANKTDQHLLVFNTVEGSQEWLDTRMGESIRDTLLSEETKFRAVLAKHDAEPMDAKTAFGKWQQEGLPLELAMELCTEPEALESLADEHRRKSQPRDFSHRR